MSPEAYSKADFTGMMNNEKNERFKPRCSTKVYREAGRAPSIPVLFAQLQAFSPAPKEPGSLRPFRCQGAPDTSLELSPSPAAPAY